MNDKELLMMAAKAAGVSVIDHEYEDCSGFTYRLREYQHPIDRFNPLNDDGDALRLAVKLGFYVGRKSVEFWQNGAQVFHIFEDMDDEYAATRRAIVRAAAEIGGKL